MESIRFERADGEFRWCGDLVGEIIVLRESTTSGLKVSWVENC